MKQKLEKYYDRFTPKERINLSLAALARGDYEELEKLCNSCKKVAYMQSDINYYGKMKRLILISFWYKLHCAEFGAELLQKIAAKDALKSEIAGYVKGACDAIGDLTFDDEEMAENHPAMLKAEKYGSKCHKKMLKIEKDISKTVSKFVAIDKALKLVCEEAGICFDNLIVFYVYNGKDNSEEIPDVSDMEADKDILEQLVIEFRGLLGGQNNSGSTSDGFASYKT